jgi:hypothetical protein
MFRHQHGESGDYAATRAATKAGGYRLASGRNETHVVENASDLPSDFLQLEIKVPIDLATFNGRRFREPTDAGRDFTRVEYENAQLRITRVGCVETAGCGTAPTTSALVVVTATGEARWLETRTPDAQPFKSAGEHVLIEFK